MDCAPIKKFGKNYLVGNAPDPESYTSRSFSTLRKCGLDQQILLEMRMDAANGYMEKLKWKMGGVTEGE